MRRHRAAGRAAARQLASTSPEIVLPSWEPAEALEALRQQFRSVYPPFDALTAWLIEQLVQAVWRIRRIPLAETALLNITMAQVSRRPGSLANAALIGRHTPAAADDVRHALETTPDDDLADRQQGLRELAQVRRAIVLLAGRGRAPYERTPARLPADVRGRWAETLANAAADDPDPPAEAPWRADAEALHRYLAIVIVPAIEDGLRAIHHRPLIRQQAAGEAIDPARLLLLSQYEVQLHEQVRCLLEQLDDHHNRRSAGPLFSFYEARKITPEDPR